MGTDAIKFPSPCGELRVADEEIKNSKRGSETFPSPCGELRVADRVEEKIKAPLKGLSLEVSVPLRGIEGS